MASESSQPSRRFLIAGMQRSGTTVTQRVVAGHPEVGMTDAEISIEPFFDPGYSAFTFGNEAYVDRAEAYPALFDAIARLRATPDVTTCGLKVAIGDLRSAVVLGNVLREYLPDVKLVLTVREDLVAQFGSFVRARSTGTWHIQRSADRRSTDKIRIDKAEFTDYATACLDAIDQLRAFSDDLEIFEVGYERDILGGTDWSDLFGFLGVAPLSVTWSTMAKVAPSPETYIENYAAMRALLDRLRTSRVFDPRARANDALAESARRDREYQAIRRAEVWLERGDHRVAARLAGDVLERDDLPTGTVVRACLILLSQGGDGVARAVRALRDLGIDCASARIDARAAEQLVGVMAELPPYDVLHIATCARDCAQPRLTAATTVSLVGDRDDLTDHQLQWGLSLLLDAVQRLGDRTLAADAAHSARVHYSNHALVARFVEAITPFAG